MNKTGLIVTLAAILCIGLLGFAIHAAVNESSVPTPTPTLLGLQNTTGPWQPELQNLRSRLEAMGLPALSQEGTVLHIHQHLDIYVNGQPITVPADIGINQAGGFISPIHTHQTDGIIHVESPTKQDFTLGQVFDIWGVTFTSKCIGGNCASATQQFKVFVNGKPVTGDPRALVLAAHQEIVVTYGTASQIPNPIPSSFTFPDGY